MNINSLIQSSIIIYLFYSASQGYIKLFLTESDNISYHSQVLLLIFVVSVIFLMWVLNINNYEPIVYYIFIYVFLGLLLNNLK